MKSRLKQIIDELKEKFPHDVEIGAAIQILESKHLAMDEGEPEGPPPQDGNGGQHPPDKPGKP